MTARHVASSIATSIALSIFWSIAFSIVFNFAFGIGFSFAFYIARSIDIVLPLASLLDKKVPPNWGRAGLISRYPKELLLQKRTND